jgi:hypothetical protein
VPLAVLGLAALAYPRVRGGARAAIALLVGFFGIVVGVEGAYYTSKVGPSGDDFTGLLSIAAGVALLVLGFVTLWRTRRREGSVLRRSLRRAAICVASLVFAFFVLYPLGVAYVGTHVARPPVDDIDLGSADVEDVQLHTSDGLTLEGSYVPSRNGAAVIVAFGRKGSQRPARMLVRHGYGVLIFDRRGEGESDGDPNPFAWDEGEKDQRAAIEFLKDRPDVEPGRIGGIGLSVGGETFLQTAARSADVKAVVSEGATARSGSELASVPGSHLAPVLFNRVATAGTAVVSNSSPRSTSSTRSTRSHRERCSSSTRREWTTGTSRGSTAPITARPARRRRSGGCPRRVTSARRRRGRSSTSGASPASSTALSGSHSGVRAPTVGSPRTDPWQSTSSSTSRTHLGRWRRSRPRSATPGST